MRNYACYGYVLEAEKLVKVLPETIRGTYLEYIQQGEYEEVEKMLDENFPKNMPIPSVFICDYTIETEDLEAGKIYCCWEPGQLFNSTPTIGLKNLQNLDLNPVNSRWVVFS